MNSRGRALSRPPPAGTGFARPDFFREDACFPGCDRRTNGLELK